MATGYGLEFQFRYSQNIFLLHVVQIGSEAHPDSYPMGAGVKRPGSEASHSPPTSAEVKKTWIYASIAQNVFMA
jgi:hypothetical protein